MRETPLGRACILPPYLLERIAENGGARQRTRALRSLSVDTSIRSARLQNALLRGGLAVRRVDVLALGSRDAPQRTVFDAAGSETLPGAVRRNEGD
ncbi:MAG TPA: protealysin propeptide domain-containing protein [Mycobacteriales bacterium]|nr:protealysin propeptide domain-containing protein [Mycobacteriales bacterium]